jgi:hypothetical protein
MDAVQTKFFITGLFFIAIFLLGYWNSRRGRPYNSLLFNAHKLIALAALVYLSITVYQANQTAPLNAQQILAAGVSLALFIATIIFGGLVILEKPASMAARWVHRLFPYLTALSSLGTLYLVLVEA